MLLLQRPEAIVAIAIALVVGITFHEFSHAATADNLGDRRPRALGRVSLNPLRHLDPLGAIFLALVGFGWGRPVPVNVAALRGGPMGMAMVAAAGPLANVAVAVALAVVYRSLDLADLLPSIVEFILFLAVALNLVLAVFNLLPIPPLDGYNVLLAFLPPRQVYAVQRYAQYGFLVLLLLVFLSYYGSPINPIGWIFDAAFAAAGILTGR